MALCFASSRSALASALLRAAPGRRGGAELDAAVDAGLARARLYARAAGPAGPGRRAGERPAPPSPSGRRGSGDGDAGEEAMPAELRESLRSAPSSSLAQRAQMKEALRRLSGPPGAPGGDRARGRPAAAGGEDGGMVRLVHADGAHEVISLRAARLKAEGQGLDLKVVSSASDPPVCRLVDAAELVLRQNEKRKEQRRREVERRKANVMKEVRLGSRIGENERDMKIAAMSRFIDEGSRVRVTIMLKDVKAAGAAERGMEIIDHIRERFVDRVHFDSAPRREGNHCMMVMSPVSKAGKGGGKREQLAGRDRGR